MRRRRDRQRGAVLVEATVIMPVLMLTRMPTKHWKFVVPQESALGSFDGTLSLNTTAAGRRAPCIVVVMVACWPKSARKF